MVRKFGIPIVFLALVVGKLHGLSTYPLALEQFTDSQESSISELRGLLKNELTLDYMKDDLYLAKWLAEKEFSVPDALQALQEHLVWRSQDKIDSILEEPWDQMTAIFPYSRNTQDKFGRPVLYLDLGQWDIAGFFEKEDAASEQFPRYFVKMLEESEMHVRRLRAEGRNVTQFNLLINIGGYSYSKHACLQCFYAYRKTGEILSAHFPSATERNVFVNVPYLYKAAYTFLGDPYRKTINIYGQDQKQWESMLLEIIDKEQFPVDLISGQQSLPLDNQEGLMEWNKEL